MSAVDRQITKRSNWHNLRSERWWIELFAKSIYFSRKFVSPLHAFTCLEVYENGIISLCTINPFACLKVWENGSKGIVYTHGVEDDVFKIFHATKRVFWGIQATKKGARHLLRVHTKRYAKSSKVSSLIFMNIRVLIKGSKGIECPPRDEELLMLP